MASRRPMARAVAHCKLQPQLNQPRIPNIAPTGRKALSTASRAEPRSGTRHGLPRPWRWAAAAVAMASPFLYFMTLQDPIRLDTVSLAEHDDELKRRGPVTKDSPMRLRMEQLVRSQQQEIVRALEEVDGGEFRQDEWKREKGGVSITCVLQDGNVFEKAGVAVSVIYGKLPRAAILRMRADHKNLADGDEVPDSLDYFVAGLSLVVHPRNPMAPTVHLNYRYFETTKPDGSPGAWWFGGGSDLTPSYLFEEDAVRFHQSLKDVCDAHGTGYYQRFKKWCDEYFYNKHRSESRGLGGIFFDDLDEEAAGGRSREDTFAFVSDALRSFVPTYVPIVQRRKDMPFTQHQKDWQRIRRGRYVEFNLVHDRGTAFGLHSPNARIESILMSLPLTADWKYMHEPEPDSEEQRLVDVLKNPKDWV